MFNCFALRSYFVFLDERNERKNCCVTSSRRSLNTRWVRPFRPVVMWNNVHRKIAQQPVFEFVVRFRQWRRRGRAATVFARLAVQRLHRHGRFSVHTYYIILLLSHLGFDNTSYLTDDMVTFQTDQIRREIVTGKTAAALDFLNCTWIESLFQNTSSVRRWLAKTADDVRVFRFRNECEEVARFNLDIVEFAIKFVLFQWQIVLLKI